MQKKYYEILGVKPNSTNAEIKKAYRELAKEHHPDKNQGDNGAADRFKEVAEAYSVVGDEIKRSEYDLNNSRNMHSHEPNRNRRNYTDGFGNGFGFDDFVKDVWGAQNASSNKQSGFNRASNSDHLDIKVDIKADITALLSEEDIQIEFKRKLFNKTNEDKKIQFKIDLRKKKYNITERNGKYFVIITIEGLGNESSGRRTNVWGGVEEYHLIGKLKVTIEVTANSNFKIVIKNPKDLSSLKFTVKGSGILNSNNLKGDYVANLIIKSPNLEKLSDKDRNTISNILSNKELY